MSIVNLKLEHIKDEDLFDYKDETYEDFCATKSNLTECGRVFIDLELKAFSFYCMFCETKFQNVYELFDHVTNTHILLTSQETEDLCELESRATCNSLEILTFPEEAEPYDDESETVNEIPQPSEHLNTQEEESLYKCDKCPKEFKTRKSLYYHSALHSGSEHNFKCTHCNQIFAKKRYLQMHLNYHLDERSFPCTVCGKQNRTAHQLQMHMVKHSSTKEYVCEICGSAYRLLHHLVTHQKQKHENKREYKCNLCEKGFNTLAFLNTHKLSHSKERKHICKICGKGFVWRKNLSEHMKLHSEVKKYNCEICKKCFFQKSGLITHKKSHTNSIASYN